jgi:hypothetical protein
MDEAPSMDLADCGGQANGDAQASSQLQRLLLIMLKNAIQGLAARIHEHEHGPPFVRDDLKRTSRPGRVKLVPERVFVLNSLKPLRRRMLCGERRHQDREWVATLPAAVKGETGSFPDGLEFVSRRHCHR